MTIARSRTFRSGNSEAVRLIYPAATTIPEMIARLTALPAVREVELRDDGGMAYVLDTNVAIRLRDGDAVIAAKVAALLDRMIAAQALLHRAVLVTMNPGDFADILGLE